MWAGRGRRRDFAGRAGGVAAEPGRNRTYRWAPGAPPRPSPPLAAPGRGQRPPPPRAAGPPPRRAPPPRDPVPSSQLGQKEKMALDLPPEVTRALICMPVQPANGRRVCVGPLGLAPETTWGPCLKLDWRLWSGSEGAPTGAPSLDSPPPQPQWVDLPAPQQHLCTLVRV